MKSIRSHVLRMNYERSDEWAGVIFSYKTTCQRCEREFVFIIETGKMFRKIACMGCGNIFREKRRLAS